MTKREIATLCCRVLAIYSILLAIGGIGYVAQLLAPYQETTWTPVLYRLVYATEPLLMCAAGFFLWRWAGLVGAWMTGHDLQDHINEAPPSPMQATLFDVQAIIFSSLGVWLLLDSIPHALSYIAQFAYVRLVGPPREYGTFYFTAYMIELVARLGLGVGLLFGGPTIARWVNRMRNIGLEKNQTPGVSA